MNWYGVLLFCEILLIGVACLEMLWRRKRSMFYWAVCAGVLLVLLLMKR